MEVGARYEAMTVAATRFASAAEALEEVGRAVRWACGLAAPATGDPGAAVDMVRFCDRTSVVMDDTARRLLEVGSGPRSALDALWTAAGGGAVDPGPAEPRRPGRSQ